MLHPTLWLTSSALEDMITEAQRALPAETGGILLGWEHDERNEIVVASAFGPGPTTVHAPNSFRPDGDWHEMELAERYERSHGRITYLGDWHVHPRGGLGMSRRDRRTLSQSLGVLRLAALAPLWGLSYRSMMTTASESGDGNPTDSPPLRQHHGPRRPYLDAN